jgi:hypothetical protein
MKIENEISSLKWQLGRNLSVAQAHSAQWPASPRPQERTGLARHSPRLGMPAHGVPPPAHREHAVARLAMAHQRLIGGNVLLGEGLHYRALPSPMPPEVHGMDIPHRCPNGA